VISHCIACPEIPLEEYECRKVQETVYVAAGSLQTMNSRLIGGIVNSGVRVSLILIVRVRVCGTGWDQKESIFLIELPVILEYVTPRALHHRTQAG
jgi:hypothetical protein